jgi:6-pyruvoyltetrahydropterin/6-carboxytetrahydropterin synthase
MAKYMIKIGSWFDFESAHHLPNHEGKCVVMHGHSYKLLVEIEGPVNTDVKSPEYGMVMDYIRLKEIVQRLIIGPLDHKVLNDIFSNPTAENLVFFIEAALRHQVAPAKLSKIVLKETEKSYAMWEA